MFFNLTVGALRTDLSEFQEQNFKVGPAHWGAQLVYFSYFWHYYKLHTG